MITTQQLQQLIGPGNVTILDIGCNDGEHTQMFLNLFPNALLSCFEPDPRAVQRFKARVTDSRAQLFEMALGALDSENAVFYQSHGWPSVEEQQKRPGGWDLSGSIRRPTQHIALHPWCLFGEVIGVVEKRLDTWAAEHNVDHVDFIWADVQGAEGDLVAGGRHVLAQTRYFYVEYSDHGLYQGQPTLAQLCATLGSQFELMQVWSDDVLFRNKECA